MIRLMLSLRDSKAESFAAPFLVPALGIAYRSLLDEVARGGEGNVLASHSGDFELFHVANFDDESGDLLTEGFPRRICCVADLVVK